MKGFISVDFETRSMIDLRKTGVYPYAEHHSTDVLCMAYSLEGSGKVLSWMPGQPVPQALNNLVTAGMPLRAWNAGFEYRIWQDILSPRYGFAMPKMEQWIDTAAEAAAMALPRALGAAADVCGVAAQKDVEGHKLMLKMCKPRSIGAHWLQGPEWATGPFATKTEADAHRRSKGWKPRECTFTEDSNTVVWWDSPEMRARLLTYCEQDVRTEMEMVKILRPLMPAERGVYLMTQRMNDRGIAVDQELVEAARELVSAATDDANVEIKRLTGGAVQKVTSVAALREWANAQGCDTDNLRKDTVRDLLAQEDLQPDVRTALQLRQDVGRTSVAKLDAFLRCMGADGRIRGMLMYHGASTGRWSGRLVQPHNFPRPMFKKTDDIEHMVQIVKNRDYAAIRKTGYPIPVLVSYLLRSMLLAEDGKDFMCADYSQIEARVLAWIAGADSLTELFRSGGKVYETMGAYIFNVPLESVAKDSFERQIGKNSVLGAGFQMGADRFAEQVHQQTGIVLDRDRTWHCDPCAVKVDWVAEDDAPACGACGVAMVLVQGPTDVAKQAINGYRELYPEIPAFWAEINQCAIDATRQPGVAYTCGGGRISFVVSGSFLFCRLPSGRLLCYAAPEIREKPLPAPYEHIVKESLFYLGVHAETNQWRRLSTYGGHLTENVVQAMARDVMAGGMLRLASAGFSPILTVHDEVLVEVDKDAANYELFLHTVNTLPRWAEGLPLTGDGWQGLRYRK